MESGYLWGWGTHGVEHTLVGTGHTCGGRTCGQGQGWQWRGPGWRVTGAICCLLWGALLGLNSGAWRLHLHPSLTPVAVTPEGWGGWCHGPCLPIDLVLPWIPRLGQALAQAVGRWQVDGLQMQFPLMSWEESCSRGPGRSPWLRTDSPPPPRPGLSGTQASSVSASEASGQPARCPSHSSS